MLCQLTISGSEFAEQHNACCGQVEGLNHGVTDALVVAEAQSGTLKHSC